MPNGLSWKKTEINRKLCLLKILANKRRALDLIEELLHEDLPELYKLYEKNNS